MVIQSATLDLKLRQYITPSNNNTVHLVPHCTRLYCQCAKLYHSHFYVYVCAKLCVSKQCLVNPSSAYWQCSAV